MEVRRQAERARDEAGSAQRRAEQQQRDFETRSRELDSAKAAYREWVQWVNNLRPGDAVYVRSFGREAVVVRPQLHRQTVLVTAGAVDLEVPLTDVTQSRTDK